MNEELLSLLWMENIKARGDALISMLSKEYFSWDLKVDSPCFKRMVQKYVQKCSKSMVVVGAQSI